MFCCLFVSKNRKEGNRLTASRRASGERPRTNLLSESWKRFRCRLDICAKHGLKTNAHCPTSAEVRYLTHLPAFRESRFFKVFQKWQRRALTHIPFVTQSTLIRAAAVVVVLGKPHHRVAPCFSFQFSQGWKVSPPCGKCELAIQAGGKSGSDAPNLTLHLLPQSLGLYAPPPLFLFKLHPRVAGFSMQFRSRSVTD